MSSPAPDRGALQDVPVTWHDEWVVAFAPDRVDAEAGRNASPFVVWNAAGSDLATATDGSTEVLFAGILTNTRELDSNGAQAADASVIARLFRACGSETFARLRGPFAVLVWDGAARQLYVGRDQIGLRPLFVARSEGRWHFAGTPQALLRLPDVSPALDAVALSEWLCGWYPAIEDTAYRDIKRVPPATVTVFDGTNVVQRRYWDPSPITEPIAWSREEDLETFEPLLSQAVARVLRVSTVRPGVFLSGGVDSISVAATATDIARAAGSDGPLALSLVFPDRASNEEAIQAGVARRLELRQHLVPLADAAGPKGLLAAALDMTASWPQPMLNLWAPAYMHLARIARREGVGLILTGRGGDEWLTVTPYVMADYVARGNLAGVWRMLAAWQRAHQGGIREAGRVLWRTAGRSLGSAAMGRLAPERWHARRRARLLAERPAWVAPDPAIRAAMEGRIERWMEPASPPRGFYVREMRTALFHPAIAHDMEETHEFGRRNAQRIAHPFWDVDLVNALYRVPPSLLMKDGRSKWLLRRRLAARLPGLGLERRVKVSARSVFQALMADQVAAAWDRLGNVSALAQAGVVSSAGVDSAFRATSLQGNVGSGRLWTLLNFEQWARASNGSM